MTVSHTIKKAEILKLIPGCSPEYDEGGEFKDNVERAAEEATEMISVFSPSNGDIYHTQSSPLRQLCASIFAPIKASATPGKAS
jgi:hypothetical protein